VFRGRLELGTTSKRVVLAGDRCVCVSFGDVTGNVTTTPPPRRDTPNDATSAPEMKMKCLFGSMSSFAAAPVLQVVLSEIECAEGLAKSDSLLVVLWSFTENTFKAICATYGMVVGLACVWWVARKLNQTGRPPRKRRNATREIDVFSSCVCGGIGVGWIKE